MASLFPSVQSSPSGDSPPPYERAEDTLPAIVTFRLLYRQHRKRWHWGNSKPQYRTKHGLVRLSNASYHSLLLQLASLAESLFGLDIGHGSHSSRLAVWVDDKHLRIDDDEQWLLGSAILWRLYDRAELVYTFSFQPLDNEEVNAPRLVGAPSLAGESRLGLLDIPRAA